MARNSRRGESGYVNADVTVSVPVAYFGAGIAGFQWYQNPDEALSNIYVFNAKVRESDFQRPRYDTSDGSLYKSGAGASVSRKINLVMYYKGDKYPPDFELYEFVHIEVRFGDGQTRGGVIMVESFKQTGEIERALEYTVVGETDGIFF